MKRFQWQRGWNMLAGRGHGWYGRVLDETDQLRMPFQEAHED
jgi:hypothetical protein